jgi:type II secretory pathway pseudopilin PulG
MIVKHNKKAFTMIEMLVCLVCLGFLCVGIGTFAAAINAHTSYIQARENDMLLEYQDVLDLKSNGLDAQDRLNFSSNLYASNFYSDGATFAVSDKITLEPNQKVVYTSSDTSVVSVDAAGVCNAVSSGVAYVKANILTKDDSDGEYHDTNNVVYIPVVIINNTYSNEFNNLNYYFYGGKYYNCWIYCE